MLNSGDSDNTHQALLERVRSLQEELAHVQAEHRLVTDNVLDIIWTIDTDQRFTWISPSVQEVFGFAPAEMLGTKLADTIAPEHAEWARTGVRALFDAWHPSVGEPPQLGPEVALVRHKEGPPVWCEVRARVLVRDDAVVGMVGVTRDIRQRKAAEESLLRETEHLNMMLDVVADGAWDWRIDTGQVHFSDTWLRSMGFDRADVQPHISLWENLIHPDDRERVSTVLQSHLDGENETYEVEYRLKSASGDYRWHLDRGRVIERDASGRAIRMLATDTDISERKGADEERARLEQRIQQWQRQEAIGSLAGGVAHDMNNLLGAISGLASVLEDSLPRDGELFEDVQGILAACRRGHGLTRNLLGLARKGKVRNAPTSLNRLVEETRVLLRRTLPRNVSIQTDLDPDLWAVLGDENQLSHVLINLAVNAADAMRGKGVVTFRTANVHFDLVDDSDSAELHPGQYVCLAVSDDGHGMTDAEIARAFDPFFTTKPKGKGTGLGLSMVFGTVENHGGKIRIDSEVDVGTTVTLYLPATKERIDKQPSSEWTPPAPDATTGTIMLVDDEPLVRRSVARILGRLGYDICHAEDGRRALEVYAANREHVSVVLLDLTMPDMDGREAFQKLRAIDPAVRVIICSGHSSERWADEFLGMGAVGYLEKPFTMETLAVALVAARASHEPAGE